MSPIIRPVPFLFLFFLAFASLIPASPILDLETPKSLQNVTASILELRAGTISVMVAGDSITQGHEGDWTWRYRLWQWFKTEGIAVDFVGPWVGTRPMTPPEAPQPPAMQDAPPNPDPDDPGTPLTTGGYAVGVDPSFDSNHYAAWERQLAQDIGQINGMVAKYNPDYLLVLLGFNDVGWFISDADGTLRSMEAFINQARAAKPGLAFALANIPQRTFIGGREDLPIKTTEYNEMLAAAIPSWSTPASPIALVEMQENYDCGLDDCPAGYDGLHPDVLGEYQIAQAFTRTLVNSFHIGANVLSIPDSLPVRPISVPSNVKAVGSPNGVVVTWDAVYGAMGYDVQSQIVGLTTWSTSSVTTWGYYQDWTIAGQEWAYMVRMSNGNAAKSGWSSEVTAIAAPQTPLAPRNVITRATATGFDVSWDLGDSSIIEYGIIFYDLDVAGAILSEVGIEKTRTSAHIDSLCPRDHYVVAVEGWNANGEGFPAVARGVTIGAGTPPPPTNLQITSIDGTTIEMAWCGSAEAAGYRFWHRNINNATDVLSADNSTTTETTYGVAFLFPGVWNFEFCISAFNGQAESAMSTCVVCPQPGKVAGGPVTGAGCYTAAAGGSNSSACGAFPNSGGSGEGGGTICVGNSCTSCTGASCANCSGSNCTTCVGVGCSTCTANASCSTCTGSDCTGCTGSDCTSCKGVGCSGCSGADCTTCLGANCGGCHGGESCSTCIGSNCAGCIGPLCTSCHGAGCSGCSGADCTTCLGADCGGCEDGESCSTCTGSDCTGCTNSDCTSCTGEGCSGCSGSDCTTCSGGGCTSCADGENCSTCTGSDCFGCNGPHCTTCVGFGCKGCKGLTCNTCIGIDCGGCLLGLLCDTCLGIDCIGCIGPICEVCIGAGCGGCDGPSCTICAGSNCAGGPNCAGQDCDEDKTSSTSKSTSSTFTAAPAYQITLETWPSTIEADAEASSVASIAQASVSAEFPGGGLTETGQPLTPGNGGVVTPPPSTTMTSTKPKTTIKPTTTTTTPPKPTPSNQISIFYSNGCDDTTCYATWYVYSTPVGDNINVCNYFFSGPDPIFQKDASEPDSAGDIPFVTSLGTFTDGTYKNCKYTGSSNGSGGGSLTCDGFKSPAICTNFTGASASCTPCSNGEGADEYCAETYCQW